MTSLRPGIYRHYKGGTYRVLGTARHSETEEWMVIYQALQGSRGYWVRPLSMFEENVDVDGVLIPRFQWQSAARPATAGAAGPVNNKTTAINKSATHPLADTSRTTPQAHPVNTPPATLDERIRAAMSSKDDKPDFSHLRLFDSPANAVGFMTGLVLLMLILWWLVFAD